MAVKFLLRDQRIRQNLIDYINQQPLNAEFPLVVSFSDPDRTLPQNSLFHALCGDVSKQLQWAGKRRNLSEWKVLFVSGHAVATGKPGEVVPGIEGEFCAIRESTSKMGIKRVNTPLGCTQALAVRQNIQLRDVRYRGDYFGRLA